MLRPNSFKLLLHYKLQHIGVLSLYVNHKGLDITIYYDKNLDDKITNIDNSTIEMSGWGNPTHPLIFG